MSSSSRVLKKIKVSLALAGAALLMAAPALASLSGTSGLSETAGAAGLGAASNLPEIIGRLIGAMFGLLGTVFIVLVIYGGFTWMTAQGNEEKIKKAKNIISSAVIGLVLVFASYAIASFVIDAVDTATAPVPAEEPAPE